jgi:integrase
VVADEDFSVGPSLEAEGESGVSAPVDHMADRVAVQLVFDNYRSGRAANTLRRQNADLALFAEYLATIGIVAGDLTRRPAAWLQVSWRIVAGFARWQLLKGYAVGTINVRLSTVKTYVGLAHKAGVLNLATYALIRSVQGYSSGERERLDEARRAASVPTRMGRKKPGRRTLTVQMAQQLKSQPNTPQGRRDALIMCLLLDHGLRVYELAGLDVTDIDLSGGRLSFYRSSLRRNHEQRLTDDALRAVLAYLHHDASALGPLLRPSRKDGRLFGSGMTERAICGRVRALGEQIGVEGLSPTDCRHHWAMQVAREGRPIHEIQEEGGWSSPEVPLRYSEAARLEDQGEPRIRAGSEEHPVRAAAETEEA